jgi:hypothetical protein
MNKPMMPAAASEAEAGVRLTEFEIDSLRKGDVLGVVVDEAYQLKGLGCALWEIVGDLHAEDAQIPVNALAIKAIGECVEERATRLIEKLQAAETLLRSMGIREKLKEVSAAAQSGRPLSSK